MSTANVKENGMSEKAVVKELVNNQLFTLNEHKANSRKLAKLKNNRDFNDLNVKNLKRSIKEMGVQQPIRVIKADYVVANEYEIIDFITGNEISKEEIEIYDVIVDGQHRVQAYLEILEEKTSFDKPLIFLYMVLEENTNLLQVLTDINNTVSTWKGGDYIIGVEMKLKGEYQLITEINKLTRKKYSLESACKWLTFGNGITKTVLNNIAKDVKLSAKVEDQLNKIGGIQRGKNILESAIKTLGEKPLKSRIIIDWIMNKNDTFSFAEIGEFESIMCNFFSSFDRPFAEKIEKAKGTQGEITKQEVIYNLLNDKYKQFLEDLESKKVA